MKVVQTRLGHASAKVTLDTYGHLFPDEEDRTAPLSRTRSAQRSALLCHICVRRVSRTADKGAFNLLDGKTV